MTQFEKYCQKIDWIKTYDLNNEIRSSLKQEDVFTKIKQAIKDELARENCCTVFGLNAGHYWCAIWAAESAGILTQKINLVFATQKANKRYMEKTNSKRITDDMTGIIRKYL